MTTATIERRGGDRRRARQFTLRWPERRTGFDRRRAYPVLAALRDRGWLLAGALVVLNVMSLADLGLTTYELTLGAAEGNPLMRMAFETGPMAVIALKVGGMLAVTAIIWRLRHYQRVLQLAVATVGLYAALLGYHAAGLATLL